MSRRGKRRLSIAGRLMHLFAVMLIAFALILHLLYNGLMRRQTILHYSETMQRDAYAIAQNLSELIAPSDFDNLDETRFIVNEENLAPYLAFIEQLTNCNVYIVDRYHNVTGYFSGIVQKLENPLLPGYLEQSIALGFMGKTPFIQEKIDGETHLTACMPVMNVRSRVLGVVLLESTLREQGYAQVPSSTILLTSSVIAFIVSGLLAVVFSRMFTRPISKLQKVSLLLAGGAYETRTDIRQEDEIGSLAQSMDTLAERLEEARVHDEALHLRQQQFFSNISHELRTPVTVIRGTLEALRDGVVRGEDTEAYYQQIIAEIQWLQRLIRELLELSRLQDTDFSLNISSFDLCDLLGDVAMSASAISQQKGVVFSCEEPDRASPFTGDYTRLRQMLLAVADNAIKFTPPGKCVVMHLSHEPRTIAISDQGVGIPADELPHIFDRFRHTQDAAHQSTGLGLAIVSEIAKRHDIAIDVRSAEGEGTLFTFTFPRE